MSSKPDWQPSSIPRASGADARRAQVVVAGLGVALAVVICMDLRPRAQTPSTAPGGNAASAPAAATGWREAPEYVNLFAPPTRREAYRAYVSREGLAATMTRLLADPAILRPPGAWTPQAMIPYDAFGLSGSYNRWKLASLYRSRRAQVAYGPRLNQGQMESWTLVTPYPDEELQRLEPGTLIIVVRVPSDAP